MNHTVKLYDDGRFLLPAKLRKKWNLKPGQELLISEEGDIATITPKDVAIRHLQEEIMQLVPPGVSMVDELIAERRQEAAREIAED